MPPSFQNRRLRVALIVGAVGAAVGGIALFRLTKVTEESNQQLYWHRQGVAVYSEMKTVRVTDVEGIRRSLDATPVEDPQGRLVGEDEILSMLRETVADFLLSRYNAESAAAYIQWMESRGYRFRSPEEFSRRYGPLKLLAPYAGIESENLKEMFERMWLYPPSAAAVPTELCISPGSMAITIGVSNHNRMFTESLHGTLGDDLWYGGSSGRCRLWMRPAVTREELVASQGEVLAAQVGVIADVPGSDRRPLIVLLFFEPHTRTWWVDEVNVNNYMGSGGSWASGEY